MSYERNAVGHRHAPPPDPFRGLHRLGDANPTETIAAQQEAARLRIIEFQYTHHLNSNGRWINNVTGADETAAYPR